MLQKFKKRATALTLLAVMFVTTVAASLSAYASDGKDATAKVESEIMGSDVSGLSESDFVSKRLVVMAEEKSDIAVKDNIIGEHGDVYLLQFDSAEETMKAYAYLKDKVTAVEPDIVVSAASKSASESGIQVDEEQNPVDALNDIGVSENTKKQHGVIALIDTGVKESNNVIDRISVIDDSLEGNGHGDKMAEAIVSQDKDARILSIRAMDDDGNGTMSSLVAAIEYAIAQDVDLINLSLYARATLTSTVLEQEILKATELGITVVGAAGNDGEDAADYIPGSIDAAYVIGAADENGVRLGSSNYGVTVDYNVVAGTTSEATALFTGFLSAQGEEAVERSLNQGLIYEADFTGVQATDDMETESEETALFTEVSQEDVNGEQTLNFKVIGKGSVVLQDGSGNVTDITGDISMTFPRMTYARLTFKNAGYVFVQDEDGTNLEPYTYQKEGSFRDISIVPGLDKSAVIVFDKNKAIEMLSTESVATIAENLPSNVTVGKKYTGNCKVTSVSQNHAGGTVTGLKFKGTSGYLKGKTVSGNCADHTAAAPFVGQACKYEMTVRKISGTNVTVYVYVTPKVGATDGVTSNENGLIGYQRMEGTAVLKRENPDVYTDLTVKKKWSDSSDAFDVRPTSIKIQLYRDTKNPVTISESTKYGSSVTLNKANKWSYTWSDVPRKKDGKSYYYSVREVSVPKYYKATGGSFSGSNEEGYTATFTNTLQYAYLKVLKSSADTKLTSGNSNYNLKGAVFTVYDDSSCKNIVGTLTTKDANGTTDTIKLLPKTYYVKETKAPKGYVLDSTVHKVTLNAGASNTLEYKVKDEPMTAVIKIAKSSSVPQCTDGNRLYSLEGAEYSVYQNEACTQYVDKIVTDESGEASLEGLALGKYWVKETKAPAGYTIDPKVYPADVSTGNASVVEYTVESEETPIFDPAAVLLKKVDKETKGESQNNGTLAGAQFEVKYYDVISDTDPALNGESPVRSWVFETNENGFLRYNSSFLVKGDELYTDLAGAANLPYGTLTFKEIKAPEGYLINDKVIVQRTDGYTTGSIVYQTPTQEEDDLEMRVTKIDATTGKPVAGAVFEHTMPDGTKAEYTTDKNGYIDINCLEYGTHKLIEKSAPDGFAVNTAEVEFKVAEDNSITVVKGDAAETDTNGKVTVDVAEDGCVEVRMENKPSLYKILVHKTNEKDTVLAGAEFTLYSDAGCKQEIAKGKTNDKGELYFEDLVVGKNYYLKETKAPAGYRIPINKDGSDIVYKLQAKSEISDGKYAFIVNDKSYTSDNGMYCVTNSGDGLVCEMTVLNYTGGQLPETGSSSMLILIGAGIVFVSAAGVIFLKRKKDN